MHRTPLNAIHREHHAKMVDFSGWDMPLLYEGIIPEHRAVRTAVGVFDVSHMGEFQVRGPGAEAYLDRMVTNRIAGLADGQAVYSAMCYEDGGTVDDLIVYRLGAGDYLMVVNASNIDKDFAWLADHRPAAGVELENVSEATALLAVQGPRAPELVARGAGEPVDDIAYYHFRRGKVWGADALIARLGYTGEDGFELMVGAGGAEAVWTGLFRDGQELGLRPAGLGARDTLRFESGFCLYGHELTAAVSPLEAGIGFAVKLDKEDFVGGGALRRLKAAGLPRRLLGLRMEGARIPRQGSAVRRNGDTIGEVTSGMYAPTLDGAYALALVRPGSGGAAAGAAEPVEVMIRDQAFPARIVDRPFYRRKRT
jgi:aminomethyltransferase